MINILGKKPSINKSNCSYQIKEACPLNGQCQIRDVVYEKFQVTNKVIRKKSILELRKNLLKDTYTIKIYLLEMNFIKTTQKYLRNSGKSR